MNKEMLKTSLILMIYTLVAGIALSLVYTITEDKIGNAELENTITAMKYVLTDENGNQVIPSEEIEKTVSEKSSEMGNVLYTDNIGTVNSPVYEFANGDEVLRIDRIRSWIRWERDHNGFFQVRKW